MSMIKNLSDIDAKNYFIFFDNKILIKKNDSADNLGKANTHENCGAESENIQNTNTKTNSTESLQKSINNDYEITFPDEGLFRKCVDFQIAHDWFIEPEYDYGTMILEENSSLPKGYKWIPIRQVFASNIPESRAASRALTLLNWRNSTRFCTTCGAPLSDDKYDTARNCPSCKKTIYPSISPCVIVRILKDDRILLARHANRNTDVYTCLAGYMEPGETIEECVKREVKEEVGLEVDNIKYLASQHWPFPDQLMIGVEAQYKSGDMVLQEDEIDEALWFSQTDLPPIPKQGSLAWRLITGEI